jgi:hypothetical protein
MGNLLAASSILFVRLGAPFMKDLWRFKVMVCTSLYICNATK